MIVQAKIQLYIPCPNCMDGSWRADQLSVSQTATWACSECHQVANIKRVSENDFETIPAEKKKETPVTVTLQSITEPRITVRLHTWKYTHSQDLPLDEYIENERYFYNQHTCPTNWVAEIQQIEFEGDKDPHGVFEFVSVEDGHLIEDD